MGCEYTLLSKLTSSSAATPPDLGGESRKADCKSFLFHKITFARRESQTPAFEALLTPGKATFTILHVPQLSAHSIPPALALPLPVPVLAPRLGQKALPPPRKQQGESGKWAGMESPRNCPFTGAAPIACSTRGFPSPGTVKQPIRALNVTEELSFLQPSQLGCWLGFLKQSLASSLAVPELVCLVRLVRRTALIPVSSRLAGRGLGALPAGGQHHVLELGASGSQSFSPHPTH